jgi:hypothetical protein
MPLYRDLMMNSNRLGSDRRAGSHEMQRKNGERASRIALKRPHVLRGCAVETFINSGRCFLMVLALSTYPKSKISF